MDEQSLLLVFIGLVALALVGIATVAVALGFQAYKLLSEIRALLEKVNTASDAAIADIDALRQKVRSEGTKVWGILGFLLSMAWRKKGRTHNSEQEKPE